MKEENLLYRMYEENRRLYAASDFLVTDKLLRELKKICVALSQEEGIAYEEESFIKGFKIALFMSELCIEPEEAH